MPNNPIVTMSIWSKLWKTCVSIASYAEQSFPPSCAKHNVLTKLCKNTTIFHHSINTLLHDFSTTKLGGFTSNKCPVFHTFHSTYYYEYESNLLIKGA